MKMRLRSGFLWCRSVSEFSLTSFEIKLKYTEHLRLQPHEGRMPGTHDSLVTPNDRRPFSRTVGET